MFNEGIYSLVVLLIQGNIIIARPDRTVIFSINYTEHEDIRHYQTDTIGELCTNTNLSDSTSETERNQFLEWFTDINNIKELYVTLQIQTADQEPLTD